MANPIRAFLDYVPSVDESCFIDETSVVIGEVSLAEDVSVVNLIRKIKAAVAKWLNSR